MIEWRKRIAGKPTGAYAVAAAMTQLTMILNYAVASKWIRSNPADYVARTRLTVRRIDKEKVLDKAEARRLIEATVPRWRPYIWFALATGMRKSELAGLQWGDIDIDGGLVHVRRQCYKGRFTSPKSEHGVRTIPLPPEVGRVMKEWKLACPITEVDLVFPSDRGNPVTGKLVDKYVFHPARKAAAFDRPAARAATFHALRHTYATTLLAGGLPLLTVSRLLGHRKVTMTAEVYAHWTQDQHDAARTAATGMYGDVRPRAESGTIVEHAFRGNSGTSS